VAVFVAVQLFALVVARTCGRVGDKVSQEEAVSIARAQIDFDAEHHQIRLFKKGLDSHPYWGVSLYNGDRTVLWPRSPIADPCVRLRHSGSRKDG
jgi:hypothetical protein